MQHLLRSFILIIFSIMLVTPGMASAQSGAEVVTAQINVTTPAGANIIGTLVVNRSVGASVDSTWTFSGMANGLPASGAGTAVERWNGNGSEEIELTSITKWQASTPQPPLMTIKVSQSGPGLVLVAGVPVAINGEIKAPGSGSMNYTVTNAGKGQTPISQLPNTAGEPAMNTPIVIAGLMIAAGCALTLVSLRLRPKSAK